MFSTMQLAVSQSCTVLPMQKPSLCNYMLADYFDWAIYNKANYAF